MRFVVCFLFFIQIFVAQAQYPVDYFGSPLDIPLTISGNFGELRSNHFHAGLDFRTQQKEGLNVYAAADGYVSRIKISTFGYGKAIYITHPTGFTTVYGHLKQANPVIDQYIRTQHYKEKEFEIDIFPKPTDLPITKGEFIAASGNTGGSGGPHLHFEIRDSKTEKAINPFLFGFDKLMVDTRLPQINSLMAYPISEDASINDAQRPTMISLTRLQNGSYLASKIKANGKIGFGINAYDLMDFSYSKNGLYKVEAFNNGTKTFGFTFDTFSFDEAKHINGLIDFPRFVTSGVRFQKLFAINPYNLSIIDSNTANGILTVIPNLNQNYRIEISDFNNNKITINIPIVYSNAKPTIGKGITKTKYFLKSKIENLYNQENISVSVPPNTFYEDFYLDFKVNKDTLRFASDEVALQNAVLVTFEKDIAAEDKSKTFIATQDGNKLQYNKTRYKDGQFSTYTKKLGTLVLARDEVAPTVVALTLGKSKSLATQSTIDFNINDSLSGISSFVGSINSKWVLFDYDFKTKKLKHTISDGIVQEGNNSIKLTVADNVGNVNTFETNFTYKKG